ncbi:MAG: nucleotidyltransferase domain-containing protein [Candidatus Peribacteraceae bacterium]|nr:nucleotidyltransferase domain-containing protein [Candidatus Peribacteraceae bacterium]
MKNSPIDLTPEHMDIVVRILRRFIPDQTVAVFGSRVHGKAKTTSDIDLVIMNESSLTTHTFAELQNAFSASLLPMKVDIVEWATTNENFRKIIEEKNVRIQGH